MQTLAPVGSRRGRVTVFVPRWIPDGLSPMGLPYKALPVMSSLARRGYEVDFFAEHLDGIDTPELRASLERADGVVAWCAELNPGVQIPGLLGFLDLARSLRPAAPRIAGGGFFALTSAVDMNLEPLADEVLGDSGVSSVVKLLDERLGHDAGSARRTEPYGSYAARELDLTPFVRPESMIFGNEDPSLQIPTGYGCSKVCNFCYYERTQVALLPARKLAELVVQLRDRYGVRQFLFGELDFLAARPRALEVARQLVALEADVRWFALVSVVDLMRLTDDDLDLLAASGCHVLEIGTETGADEAIAEIGKQFVRSDAIEQTRRLLARDIVPLHNIMLGFDGESRSERQATLSLIHELRSLDERVRFNFRVYQGVPNTSMGERVLSLMPALPTNLEELLAFREAGEVGRAMPWLTEEDEESVRLLVDYLLPLAYDDHMTKGRESTLLRTALRYVARLRCRLGFFRFPFDHDLFRKHETVGVAGRTSRDPRRYGCRWLRRPSGRRGVPRGRSRGPRRGPSRRIPGGRRLRGRERRHLRRGGAHPRLRRRDRGRACGRDHGRLRRRGAQQRRRRHARRARSSTRGGRPLVRLPLDGRRVRGRALQRRRRVATDCAERRLRREQAGRGRAGARCGVGARGHGASARVGLRQARSPLHAVPPEPRRARGNPALRGRRRAPGSRRVDRRRAGSAPRRGADRARCSALSDHLGSADAGRDRRAGARRPRATGAHRPRGECRPTPAGSTAGTHQPSLGEPRLLDRARRRRAGVRAPAPVPGRAALNRDSCRIKTRRENG